MQRRQTKISWRHIKFMPVAALLVLTGAGSVFAAADPTSDNYQVTETSFGSGSTLESCSEEFCARASIGDIATGSSSSGESTAEFGSVTPDEPMLEVIVEPGESNLGVLTTESTSSKTTTIRVRNYLSGGYTLQISGAAPKYANHTLATPSSPTAADPGTEQFGINAVANTTPSIGSNPVQVPSNETSFGFVTADYQTPNLFKYQSGDIVAQSNSESGRTDYTISMIVNIANNTPAGRYQGDYSAIVIPTY